MDSDPFNIKYLVPLNGTDNAEVDKKFITYYAFPFRINGNEIQKRLDELEIIIQQKNQKIETLNVSNYSFIL
jgi:hypothetical protein